MKNLFAWSILAATAAAKVGIILPIYSYPTTSVGEADWSALVRAATANPTLDFYVIINDDNGPEPDKNKPEIPGDIGNWAPQMDALNKLSNTHLIGYIYTALSSRNYAAVTQAVDQYANWKTNGSYDIHVDGIFFDVVEPSETNLGYNTNITNYAKKVFNETRNGTVVLNPGVLVPAASASLFDLADTIVQIETCYTNVGGAYDNNDPSKQRCVPGTYYNFTPTLLQNISDSQAAKSSVLVHDYYDDWYPNYRPASNETLETDVKAILEKQVHSFYITQYGWNGNFSEGPASIENVARLAAQGQR